MKHITLVLSLLLLPLLGMSAHVDLNKAVTTAQHYLAGTALRSADGQPLAMELAVRMTTAGINPANADAASTYYYVFNLDHGAGFIIVAGDDAVTPILGYSDHGAYDPAQLPENMAKWMEGYQHVIATAIVNGLSADTEVAAQWLALQEPATPESDDGERAVNPLLTTQWNQSPYYNAQCPGGSVTGCVATAMAQVMKYWNHPATGTGFHSYVHQQYGTLSANFASTTFNWGSMPNSISSPNSAIATLMYAAGVSVDMNYSPESSGAYVINAMSPVQNCSEYALETYFGYSTALQGVIRSNYTEPAWVNLMKAELDAGRPIIYAGIGSGGGHCFDLDGYNNSNLFHVNWGWGGYSDGYFAIGGMNPPGVGTGGGDGGFNSDQHAVIGVVPATGGGTQNADLELYAAVTPSPNPIYYGQAFTVNSNILNNATTTFNGDYCAALFDAQGTFVDYVATITGASLPAGYVYNAPGLNFDNPGNFAFLPGNYSVGVFFRPTGGNWQQVADANGYTNLVPFTIINPNDIELYSVMNVTTGLPMTQGASTSVNMDVANYGANDITATVDLSLFNLDGSFAQTIAELPNTSLPSGFWVGPLTFTNNISVAPGSYLMALTYTTDNVNYQLVGSSNYSNPIMVTVQSAGIQADPYEVNNAVANAHQFTPTYSNNTANVNTTGSNCHIVSDEDFYKFPLPAGYGYDITARLHDSYNSANGNTYTLDALFTYSTDGVNWSQAYDDVMPNNILVGGGGTLYFHVSPYFQGQTGTYLLNADIVRTPSTGVVEGNASDARFQLMPNPAMERLNVVFPDLRGGVMSVRVLNAQGQEMMTSTPGRGAERTILDVSALAGGVYYVQVTSADGICTRPFLKAE
jgi:hypothetical protein